MELAACAVALAALILHLSFSAPIAEPPHFLLFLGRFHPLVVHLPIGILILVGLLEVLTLWRRYKSGIDDSIDVILPLAIVGSITAFSLGLFLAQDGGFGEGRLLVHRRWALAAVLFSSLQTAAWATHRRGGSASSRWGYRVVTGVALLCLSIASHHGGTLSRGDDYLVKYAPEMLKPLVGGTDEKKPLPKEKVTEPSSEPLLFSHAVQPVLDEYCVDCHGDEKQKGGLRLDSFDHVMKGGDSGPSVVPFDGAGSLLVSRMLLPEDDDDKMPPQGEAVPTAGEIAMVQFWIKRGADTELRLRDLLPPMEARKSLERALAAAHTPPPKGAVAPPETKAPAEVENKGPTGDVAQDSASPSPAAQETSPKPEAESADPPDQFASPAGAFNVLQEKCADCHGPSKQKGRLRVDSVAALEKGGASGPGVKWGDSAGSLIVQAVKLPLDHADHMPPKKKPQLSPEEVALIARWVKSKARGAATAPSSAKTISNEGESDEEVGGSAEDASPGPDTEDGAQKRANDEGSKSSGDNACTEPSLPLPHGSVWLFDDLLQPLFLEKCGDCHGSDLASGGLRVDSCSAVHAGGNEGIAIVAGQPMESRLYTRMLLPPEDDEHMPPVDYPQLTNEERHLVMSWIEQGATRDVVIKEGDVPSALQERISQGTGRASADEGQSQKPSTINPPSGGCAACTSAVGSRPSSSIWFFGVPVLFWWRRSARKSRSA